MTEASTPPVILMVDDEPNILDGYRRALHGRFNVVSASSGAEGLTIAQQAFNQGMPFPVVVSDMMMPTMNGAEFLGKAREIDPEAIQLLLSGQADLDSTISAVNNGKLFRFLTKPCAAPDLELALSAALEQHRLVHAERELLEQTLSGAVSVLTELLSMGSPEAFTRTQRVQTVVDGAAAILGIEDWRLPLASMLSQIGCIAVPGDVLHRARTGGELTDDERAVYLAHPQTALRLLERIPRLEDVARWIGSQPVRPPGLSTVSDEWHAHAGGSSTELSETLLRAGIAFLAALDATGNADKALAQLTQSGHYPAHVLDCLDEAATALAPQGVRREIKVSQVLPGMLLEADVETLIGMTLVRKGERITEAVAMRLENFAKTVGVQEPIIVLVGV
ncbi:MAG TPA: HD domain-containing phosphohydrolase [Kineosporiaceae bacterium]|nr:HD domain-containing phosphohydrolase [Kineosporiaceae bacterium]